jgi:hypothetical protein
MSCTRLRGSAWPPRKDPGDGHPLLIETGALQAAATGKHAASVHRIVDRTELQLGVDPGASNEGGIPWAVTHQEGNPAVNIAQREFAGISDETADKCAEIVADHKLAEIG